MRYLYFLILLFFLPGPTNAEPASPVVSQEIRYTATGAHEVWLVWGMNNWQGVPKACWPRGSYMKDNLLYSPMQKKDDHFSVTLVVPKNTLLDYVFWISKGFRDAPTDVWDVNEQPEKDYHTLALVHSAIVIESKVKAMPREMLSLLDLAKPLFILIAALLVLFHLYFGKKILYQQKAGHINSILSASITLFIFLLFIRCTVIGAAWNIYHDPLNNLDSLLVPALGDFLFVAASTIFFLVLAYLFKKFPRAQKWIAHSAGLMSCFFLVVGILNIRVVEALGKPFTYQWLYYSDFLNSTDAKAAVSANMDAGYLLHVSLLVLSACIFCFMLIKANKMVWQTQKLKKIGLASFLTIALVYLAYASNFSPGKKWDVNRLSNPVVAFLQSVNPFSSSPELFTMSVADSLQYSHQKRKTELPKEYGKIKNVVLFVLESTPAEYISAYGSKYDVTPELSKYLDKALVFKNIYAHAPATNNSMVSLLGSIYPMISYATLTQENPEMAIPTLSSELKKCNYRTAFFNSADNRFQRAGEFLAQRKFDLIKDCHDHTYFKANFADAKYLDGNNDENTMRDMIGWMAQNQASPFFTMMWTYQTHYPYFVSDVEIDYSTGDPVFNRYLNAVHHSDKVFGQLMDFLRASGLYESTLVVLVGDHGEAFGRHGQTTHASHIYEENLHVPCVFINPAFTNKELAGMGGLIDIAPTIMSVLKQASPQAWQGRDLFTANENDRVYFFASWSDYLFGYREGKHKYIFNATRNLTEVYDLEADPLETHNIVEQVRSRIEISHQRMAGWVQSVNRFIEQKTQKEF